MNKADIEATYPIAAKRPKEVFCTKDQQITFSINHTMDKLTLIQLPAYKKLVFEKQFSHPNIRLLNSTIQKIDNQDFIVMDWIMPIGQAQLYNLLFVTALEGSMLIGSFNCPENLLPKWQVTFKAALDSIQILVSEKTKSSP